MVFVKFYDDMYCRYCGQIIEEDSVFCRYCGKQLKEKDEISDSRIITGAVFSDIISENNGLIELYPYTCNLKYVVPGCIENGFCHIFMKDVYRNGEGFDGKYNHIQTNSGDYSWVEAHLNDGKGTFSALLYKLRNRLDFQYITYVQEINNKDYCKICCSRYLHEEKQKVLGVTVAKESYLSWSAEHYPTDAYCKINGIIHGNMIITIDEWMDKYSSYFWVDVQKYYDDLERFLGVSPYDFFEYDKYK